MIRHGKRTLAVTKLLFLVPLDQKLLDPLQRAQNILGGIGIREADIALAINAEIRPANGGNARFLE